MIVGWALCLAVAGATWYALGRPGLRDGGGLAGGWATAGAGGLGLFWLGLWGLDAVGVAWTRASVLALATALAALVALGALAQGPVGPGRRTDPPAAVGPRPSRRRWLLPAGAVAVFAAATAAQLTVHPDFIYHWGVKGAKHFLAGGLDMEFLGRPWNHHVHPDYPSLLPGLLAAAALLAGRFDAAAALALSVPFFGLLVLAVDHLAARLGLSPAARFWTPAAIAWGVLAFAVGFRQAGGADLPLAAAATLGAAALAGGGDQIRRRDAEVAAAALLAASVKIEGIALGGLLVLLHAARRAGAVDAPWPARLRRFAAAALRSGALPAVAVVAWVVWVLRADLFLATNTGGLDLARAGVVVEELVRAAAVRAWYGLPLLLLALPALVRWRPGRAVAVLLLGQLAFYLFVYLTAPVDTRLYVMTSAPRLFLHLLPATCALVLGVLDAWSSAAPDQASASTSAPPVRPSFLA